MRTSMDWFEEQERATFPALYRGDIFLSLAHGSLISALIARLQGRHGADGGAPDWSHCGVYVGNGMIAESTFPKGKRTPLRHYMADKFTFEIFTLKNATEEQRAILASEATRLSYSPYDTAKFARELVNNFFERLTWNVQKQRGWRPLSFFDLDTDGERRNVCSEAVERAIFAALRERITLGELGVARPLEIARFLSPARALPLMRHERGMVTVEMRLSAADLAAIRGL